MVGLAGCLLTVSRLCGLLSCLSLVGLLYSQCPVAGRELLKVAASCKVAAAGLSSRQILTRQVWAQSPQGACVGDWQRCPSVWGEWRYGISNQGKLDSYKSGVYRDQNILSAIGTISAIQWLVDGDKLDGDNSEDWCWRFVTESEELYFNWELDRVGEERCPVL